MSYFSKSRETCARVSLSASITANAIGMSRRVSSARVVGPPSRITKSTSSSEMSSASGGGGAAAAAPPAASSPPPPPLWAGAKDGRSRSRRIFFTSSGCSKPSPFASYLWAKEDEIRRMRSYRARRRQRWVGGRGRGRRPCTDPDLCARDRSVRLSCLVACSRALIARQRRYTTTTRACLDARWKQQQQQQQRHATSRFAFVLTWQRRHGRPAFSSPRPCAAHPPP